MPVFKLYLTDRGEKVAKIIVITVVAIVIFLLH